MISQQTIQQILSRIDIIEIVGGFVKLKKRGTNYLGLCPFHNEKTPSFTVSPTKEIYKCFGCGKSGNTINFLMDHEKYSYVEALKWLANKYNVTVEETYQSPEVLQQKQTGESLYIINQFAQQYFSEQLFETEDGKNIALSYLKERGFREDIIQKFQLGFSPVQRDAFAKAALQKQFNPELLIKTGIVVNRNDALADNYRERIIFPVHNTTGKIIGFGARVIGKKENAPKYINTPENEIYVKSRILYGSYFARQAIDKNDECLLVEGYTDVIALHQAGIENVVASGGTSLTPDQLRLIRKYTNNLTILYDGDAAGVKAALRGLDLALEEGLHVRVVLIPDKEDPDSYVNKLGAAAFTEFIQQNKKDVILFQLEVMLKDAGNDSVKKAEVVNQVAETISRINKAEDFTRQEDYIRHCSSLLKIDEGGLHTLVNKFIRERISKLENKSDTAMVTTGGDVQLTTNPAADESVMELLQKDGLQEKAFVRCLLEFGLKLWDDSQTVADYIFNEGIDLDMIDDPKLQQVIQLYQQWYKEGLEPGPRSFLYHEDQELNHTVITIMEVAYEMSPKWKERLGRAPITREESYREEVHSVLTYLKLRKIKRMMDENQRDMERPHSAEELATLIKTHQHLKSLEQALTLALGTVIFR